MISFWNLKILRGEVHNLSNDTIPTFYTRAHVAMRIDTPWALKFALDSDIPIEHSERSSTTIDFL
jgi:hypothetical protein